MKNKIIAVLCLMFSSVGAYSWEFGAKLEGNNTSTDNVNASKTNLVADKISTLGGYVQTKESSHRIRLKGKVTRYDKTTENDSNYFELGYQYKPDKTQDYGVVIFQEKFTATPTISNDVTYDNNGMKLSANFINELSKEVNGLFGMVLTRKNYTNNSNRKDTKPDFSLGIEFSPNTTFTITPELSVSYNKSSDTYYSYLAYGPSVMLSIYATETVELTGSYSAIKTNYSDRTFSKVVNNRTQNIKEEQTLKEIEFGVVWSLFDLIDLSVKHSIIKNTSNNNSASTTKEYDASETRFGLSFLY